MRLFEKKITDEIYNRYTQNDFIMDRPRFWQAVNQLQIESETSGIACYHASPLDLRTKFENEKNILITGRIEFGKRSNLNPGYKRLIEYIEYLEDIILKEAGSLTSDSSHASVIKTNPAGSS